MRDSIPQYRLLREIEEMRGRLSELGERRFGEAWERMRKNENRYRSLFEDASTGLWEEDWSLVREYLQSLRDSGISDLKGYFLGHPDSASTCLDLIRLIDVNRAALELCRTDHRRKFCFVSGSSDRDSTSMKLLGGVLRIFDGARDYTCQVNLEVSPGELRHLLLRIQVPPEFSNSLERVFLSVTDVTPLKRTEERLRRRLKLEEMVQKISRRFLFHEDLDRAIEESLAEVGACVGASRSYVFLFDGGMARMDNTHEWCELGVPAERDNLQGISTEGRDWWIGNLRDKGQILIEDLASLPEEARQERDDLENQGIRSLVVMSFGINDRPLGGFVGLDNIWSTGFWDRMDLTLLRVLADLLGAAMSRRETERLLKMREERFESLFNSISDGVYVFPLDRGTLAGTFSEVNDVACGRLGYTREELLQMEPLDVIVPERREYFLQQQEVLLREGRIRCENWHRTRDGRTLPVEITSTLGIVGGKEYVITLSRDISDRRDCEKRMEHLASHDSLTGLLNRKTLDRLMEWESEKCRKERMPLGLLLIDVDDLHSINLGYGSLMGDEVLRELAELLRDQAGGHFPVGRYGGDRFLLLLPGQRVGDSGLGQRISAALERRNAGRGGPLFPVTVSQGAADWEPELGLPVSATLLEAVGKLEEVRWKEGAGSQGGCRQERLSWGGK